MARLDPPVLTDLLLEPPDAGELELLRRAVGLHGRAEQRLRFPAALHAGVPGGPPGTEVVLGLLRTGPLDHALRTDLVEALLGRARPSDEPVRTLVWLTRPGELDLEDADLAWAAAVRSAHRETGRPVRFVVVTRHGWRDPISGARRRWRRLRL